MPTVTDPSDVASQTRPTYAKPPSAVLRDASLSRDARLLYVLLDDRAGSRGSVRVRIETLAADLDAGDKSVRRWLAELRAAGLVTTKSTGRSLSVTVANAARLVDKRTRTVTSDRSERSPVTALQSSKSGESSSAREPVELVPSTPTDDDGHDQDHRGGPYLAAIREATGHRLRPTTAVREHLAVIRRQNLEPADVGTLCAAYLHAHGSTVRSPGAWLADFVLAAIADGDRPAPTASAPTMYGDVPMTDPCGHGEPRGDRYCALCRAERTISSPGAWMADPW